MKKELSNFIDDPEIPFWQDFLFSIPQPPSQILLHNDILLAFQQYLNEHPEAGKMHSALRFLGRVQEILHLGDRFLLVYRHRRANCRIYSLEKGDEKLDRLTIKDFLTIKEKLIKPDLNYHNRSMLINLAPFYDYGPSLKDPDTIGDGIRHLNRYMSTNLAQHPEHWNSMLYEFLKLHHMHGVQLLLDGAIIKSTAELENAFEDAVDFLERCDCLEDLLKVKKKLRSMGFLDGWGDTVGRMLETIQLLQDIIEQPNEETLEEFLSRIPMVSKVVLVSPHGWFGQENVLGRPDTGGQVVYILDQVKTLEKHLEKDLRKSGFAVEPKILIVTRLIPENEGTMSDQRLEKVQGTKNVWILRVPFRDEAGNVVPHWISRFKIWPYLDQFALDVEKEIFQELQGRPDLLVGNYSDGNLVAALLSARLGVIQCNIAHALEKSKYLFSDLYWENFEGEYHFSVQFIADLIAMNLANFIISSTKQEIIGTESTIGQYESYEFFTMPGLMQVISGINLFHPRFNVIPPGVNELVFFPYSAVKKRVGVLAKKELELMLFEVEDEGCLGHLDHPDLPPIFSIARLDRIKNLTGLVEAYGKNQQLRSQANIVIVASKLDSGQSRDAEEAEEIRKMHCLIEQYQLRGSIRWIGRLLSKEETGETYRIMADRNGIFVQPALFEAFGLTILEAMHSGLPVFVTQFGGPSEIIEHQKSGFLINPTDPDSMTVGISDFFATCQADKNYWRSYSRAGIERAKKHFTWDLHCQRLIRLTKVYGFWRYSISDQAKSRLSQYCHLLYHLFFKPRARKVV
jgi:sucrose synthase